jgi:hypothetical protein
VNGLQSTVGRVQGALSLYNCLLLTISCGLTSCVPLDQLPAGSVPMAPTNATATAFPDLDPGNATVTTTHFTIKGYSQTDLDNLKLMSENLINKIGADTGLYTFLASQNYALVAYRDRDEYLKKTHQPSWSHAVLSGKAIYFYYPDPEIEPILAHYMTHLVFASYMGDKAATYKWLDEGLAMSEEVSKMLDSDRSAYQTSKSSQLRQNRMPFSQMTFFVTNTEEKRRTDAWYQQVESVATYLLAQGSQLAFAQFLSELNRGTDIDQAISDAYPSKFRSFNDLEAAWKYTI